MPDVSLPRELCRFRIANDEFIISEYEYWLGELLAFTESGLDKLALDAVAFNCKLLHTWIAMLNGKPVAFVAITEEMELSCAVHQDYRGQGLGSTMVGLADGMAKRHRINELRCRFDPANAPARKIANFEGFEPAVDAEEWRKEIR